MKKVNFLILGATPCKKNMLTIRRSYRGGKRTWIAPNDKYQAWEKGAGADLWAQSLINEALAIADPVWLKVIFYRKRKRKIDLSNLLQSIEDAMVRGGVIMDDSQIKSFDGSRVYFGHDDERVEITLYWPFKEVTK
jgi:Holliday junction resolvase RusA-like endonuclease